jgi:DNA-binding CsgD family transcriptional regulator
VFKNNVGVNIAYNPNNGAKGRYALDQRRRQVATLLAKSKTEAEIATELGVTQMTVSRDVKILRQMSQQFVFDLAKSDLAYYYRDCIAGIEAVKRKAWDISDKPNVDENVALKALRLAKDCDVARFELLQNGPSVLNVKCLNDRVVAIEERSNGSSSSKPNQQSS